MLGEEQTKELNRLKTSPIFTEAEISLIDFIIQNKKFPNYVNDNREYQILSRLRNKFKKIQEKAFILLSTLKNLQELTVSNKLVEGEVN